MRRTLQNFLSVPVRIVGILATLFFLANSLNAQLVAFPGAEGAGRFTTGGRGTLTTPTTVFAVTRLDDDSNPGSLRYALTQPATYRTVVFRVSGTIRLLNNLNIPGNTTIAGQTAPGDGICIADKPLTINGDNIIIRYIRVRLGDRYQQAVNGNDDAMSGTGRKNIIIDHCTMSWSNDEAFTIYDGDSTTAQWNIISEPLNFSYHDEGSGIQNHGFGGIWGGKKSSFHHNLIVSAIGRTPRFNGSRTLSPFTAGLENVDFRNNVIYNWGSYSTNGGEGGNYNMVNNYYKYGPSTSTGNSVSVPVRGMIVQPSQSTSAPVLPYGKFFLSGNYVDGNSAITANNWLGVSMNGGTQADTTLAKQETEFAYEPVTTQAAQVAYNLVLQKAGASLKRDTLDQRIVQDVRNRTGRIIDVQGGYPAGTAFTTSQNAWPTLQSTPAPTDTDGDGMPDAYETANGLNPNDASDRNGIAANNYTNLENYINGILNVETVGPPGTALVVAKDGSGDFTTVQAAIDAAPTGLTAPYIIFIKNGKYYEKINIPSNKPFIHLVGESVANTILYYDDGASDPLPGGGTIGTQNSASFTVNATDFAAFNITFANTYGDGTQGVAVLVNNDRAVFKNCRFLGNQDTLYLKGSGTPRHYFKNCYIDGNVDFIFGSAIAVFDSTVVYAKSRTNSGSSYITAANTPPGQTYGFVFRDGSIPNNTGATQYFLGRPWQNSTGFATPTQNKTVWLNTQMSGSIRPEGWSVWDAGTNTSIIYYGEYQSRKFDGSLVDISQRVPWSFQLNTTEAAGYINTNLFGSWDPCAVASNVCTAADRDIAISNFRAKKEATQAVLDWNISWAKDQLKYELYRSLTRNGGYTKIGEIIAANDTSINFQLTDGLPVPGTSHFYYLIGSKAGYADHITDTLEVSGQPTIITTGTIQEFGQNIGTPSGAQTLTISGENLLGDVVVSVSAPYQISADGGTTWVNDPTNLSFTPVNNVLTATSIQIRLNAPVAGAFPDSVVLTTTGGQTVYVSLAGNAVEGDAPNYTVLQHWPFTTSGQDSAGARAQGVLPSTPSFNNLYLSNGTTVAAIPAYSTQYGQAFGATADGSGAWGTAAGGPGGTLRRNFYEQFTVTADNGYQLRIDSLYVTGAFYQTSSNTRLAVVYSRDGFATDSNDVFTIPGGFSNPISLPNQSAGPTANFILSVAGQNGITLDAGETLTFRFYFSCSSSSLGRYAMLKDVKIIGESTDLASLPGVLQHWPFTTNANDSLGARSPGVTASTPTFNNLYVSNGVAVPAIPAYSTQFGQAFGPTPDGSGNWSTGAGGPGGTLRRNFYQQFTVTAKNGYEIKADSIFVTGAFYNTSSNTRLAVVYSRSGFTSNDSTDVSSIPGGFANPISLANQTGGPTNRYRLAINGLDGITLAPNETLTFRFYFSCSSSSPGRYAMLKDVQVYGKSTKIGPTADIDTANASLQVFAQDLGSPSAVQSYTVSAVGLEENLLITPPDGFEISNDGGTTWYTNTNPLTLIQVNGDVQPTTIDVRLNATAAGSYGGDITHTSTTAPTINVPVSGTTIIPPGITAVAVLTDFLQVQGTPTAAQSYTVSAIGLTTNISITPPPGYEISADNGTTWVNSSNSLTLTQSGGVVPETTILIRLNAGTPGTYGGLIQHRATGAPNVDIAVNGQTIPVANITVTPNPNTFTQVIGTPSATQTYSVTGVGLQNPVTITLPTYYQLSVNGGTTWVSSVTLTPTNFQVQQDIQIRLNAPIPGTFTGNAVHTATGANTVNIPLIGYTSIGRNYVVYPVPAAITIFVTHPVSDQRATLTVFNSSGQKLYSYAVEPSTVQTRIDISRYAGGIYFIEYRLGDQTQMMRFLKK